jgi:NitT/TauT family transport system substrate-binding protein
MGLKRKLTVVVASALALLSAGMAADAAAAEKVRVGICVSWPDYSFYEVVKQKNLAPGYDIEQTIFEDPVGGHSALAAGQIDVYYCTGDYTPLAAERGTDTVNVAFTSPSYGVDQIVLVPGVTPETLKGKKVAAPQAYIGQLLMGLYLDSIGITPKDVEWVNLNADEAVGPIMSGDLAAAYLYEPWISKVTAAMKDAKSVANTSEPYLLQTGIFSDVLYMNKKFIAEHRKAAVDMLRAHFQAVQYWHDNTDEVNQLFAEFLKWPVDDVKAVVGTNGKFLLGGTYTYDFDEAARFCGVLEGDGPLGTKHGGIVDTVKLTNDWWVKLGLMQKTVDPAAAVDCSLLGDLVKEGFRQSIAARS